jgi:hypothetical protein
LVCNLLKDWHEADNRLLVMKLCTAPPVN